MNTDTRQVLLPRGFQLRNTAMNVGRFLWLFVQMVLAMEAGMMIYHLLIWPVLARIGFGALTSDYPLFGYWTMVASMVLGMIALMAYHRSTWRYSLEMSLAMISPLAALTVLVLCSWLPIHTLYGIGDPVMFVAMAAFMLLRPHQHAHGAHEHAGHEHAGSPEAEITQHAPHNVHVENPDEHPCHTA